MAHLKSHNLLPPGGWRYVQPETAERFTSDSFDDLVRQVRAHRAYKSLPLDRLAADIEAQLCLRLTTEYCAPEPGEDYRPVRDLTAELTTELAASLTRAVTAFLASGAQLVPRAEAERRAALCRGCPLNQPAKLCSCSAVYALVEALVPKDRRLPGLSVCMACGCALQAKANLPAPAIAASLPADLVLPPWCWQLACRDAAAA